MQQALRYHSATTTDNGQPAVGLDAASLSLEQQKADDIDLVRRISSGDRKALGRLYDRYASVLLGLVLQILFSREEAEEVLQEILLQVWRQADRYDPSRASVRTWLTLMARSRAIDRRRVNMTRKRTVQNAQRYGVIQTRVEPEGAHNVWLSQLRRRLRRELRKIPPAQRQIIELLYFGGLTQTQVAERMKVPLGTVKTRNLLGMKKLKRALGADLQRLASVPVSD